VADAAIASVNLEPQLIDKNNPLPGGPAAGASFAVHAADAAVASVNVL
jgi:hypothetical protein